MPHFLSDCNQRKEGNMRIGLVGMIWLLFLVAGCMPYLSDQMLEQSRLIDQARQGKTVTTEQGAAIDESKAKNIQIGVHKKQDIETWFGKPASNFPLGDQNHPHPDGCVEMWTYMNVLMKQWGPIQARKSLMLTETLNVGFNKDGKVCTWSLMGTPQDMTTMSMESVLGRPIDESKAKNITNGVQTKQDIEKWFGTPKSMGFGKRPNDPKGCIGDVWMYQHTDTNRKSIPGQPDWTMKILEVKFDKDGKVCTSSYLKRD